MVAEIELAQSIELVLPAMLQALEESVAERQLCREPRIGVRVFGVPPGHEVEVAIISGELHKAGSSPSGNVRSRQVNGVIAFADIEGPAIYGNCFDNWRDQEIGIGIAVAMGVGRKVVWVEKVADLKELSDRLPVIAGNTWREVLRRFYSSRGSLDGQARDGDWCPWPAGVRVQHLVVNDDTLSRVGGQGRPRRSYHCNGLLHGDNLRELQSHLLGLNSTHTDREIHRHKRWGLSRELILPRIHFLEIEVAFLIGGVFADDRPAGISKLYLGAGNGRALWVEDAPSERARLCLRYGPCHADNGKGKDCDGDSHFVTRSDRYLAMLGSAWSLARVAPACSEPKVFSSAACRKYRSAAGLSPVFRAISPA